MVTYAYLGVVQRRESGNVHGFFVGVQRSKGGTRVHIKYLREFELQPFRCRDTSRYTVDTKIPEPIPCHPSASAPCDVPKSRWGLEGEKWMEVTGAYSLMKTGCLYYCRQHPESWFDLLELMWGCSLTTIDW